MILRRLWRRGEGREEVDIGVACCGYIKRAL